MNSENRVCKNCKTQFTIEPEDFDFYTKIKVPPPTFCFECRTRRRLSYRNERFLYKRRCDRCGKDVISMYDPRGPYTVYCRECWWSDKWDPSAYGREYDFKLPFFEQYSDLLKRTPLLGLSNLNSVDSDYSNFTDNNKNCYLVFGSGYDENVRYARMANWTKDSMDILNVMKCELVYDSVNCTESFRLQHSRNCKNCVDSSFLYACRGCSNCFGCANLVGKSYCFFNVQYTPEEYKKLVSEFDGGSYKNTAEIAEKFNQVYLNSIHKYSNIIGSVNCTGDNINSSKNCKKCFDAFGGCENVKNSFAIYELKDSYDGVGQYKNDFSYENVDNDIGNLNKFTITVYASNDVNYAFNCHNAPFLFGCTGIKKKSYCILNKQYSKEEYGETIPRIIEQMKTIPYMDKAGRKYEYGEFFPSELSPFAYNETIAQEYFPLTEAEAEAQGYVWKKSDARDYKITIKQDDIPDNVKNINDSILNQIIGCEHDGKCVDQCTTAFKIIPEELQFYRKMNLPLPRLCPNCRHYQRLKQRNPLKLWHRKCRCAGTKSEVDIYRNTANHFHGTEHCPNEFETSYAPDRPEIVYCEQCYQAEVA